MALRWLRTLGVPLLALGTAPLAQVSSSALEAVEIDDPLALHLTLARRSLDDTEALAATIAGTSASCTDDDPAHCNDPMLLACPSDNARCCRSCLALCEKRGGVTPVDHRAYLGSDAPSCTVPRGPPANWARPERPFIVEVLTPAEAEILVPWGALESARGTRVKVMTRPLCGSNFQDSTCTYAEVDAGALAATLRTGRGDGPQAQLRLMRFRHADPDGRLAWGNYTGDLLAFWQRRTTAGAGELAASLYNRTLKNPQVAAALARVGVLNPATGQTKDYQHARYSALWVASAGSRTPMHFDPWPSLLLQLQGRKHVVVGKQTGMGPGAPLVGHAFSHGGGFFDQGSQELPPGALSCVLAPGELLFIPPGWFHDVYALDPVVSLGLRLPQWSEDEAAKVEKTIDPTEVVLELKNRLPLAATLQWLAAPGAVPKPAGRLKPADEHGAATHHQRTHQGHRFQVLFADGRTAGPFEAGATGRSPSSSGSSGSAAEAAWAAAVSTRVKPDREGLRRTTTLVDLEVLLRLQEA